MSIDIDPDADYQRLPEEKKNTELKESLIGSENETPN